MNTLCFSLLLGFDFFEAAAGVSERNVIQANLVLDMMVSQYELQDRTSYL